MSSDQLGGHHRLQLVFRANTEDGKVLLKHFQADLFSPGFVAVGSKVYFATSIALRSSSVLWLTDGTANGTVKDVSLADPNLSLYSYNPISIVAGDRLYFEASVQPFGTELWVSDGSPGTHLIRDIDPLTADSNPQ